jgi:hypothetical protein
MSKYFIYGSLNGTFSSSDDIGPKDRTVSECTWINAERSALDLI